MIPGYGASRFNAARHGLTARHVVLPWEDAAAYQLMLEALLAEHHPMGPTEQHLVEQLAALFWRQQRVLQAETAAIRDGLREQLSFTHADRLSGGALAHLRHNKHEGTSAAVQATEQDSQVERADVDDDEAQIQRALRILKRGGRQVYERALAALRADTRAWWQEALEEAEEPSADDQDDGEAWQADAASLRGFLEEKVLPYLARQRQEIEHRPLIRGHAFGMAIVQADLERLGRYETHLTRQIQRMLAMLMRLRENRTTIQSNAA